MDPKNITEDEFRIVFEQNAMTEARIQKLSVLEGLDIFNGADGIKAREEFSRRTYASLHTEEHKVSVRDAINFATGYVGGYRDHAVGYP